MTERILSIIPARGGSKGLLGKNIIDLAGMPLIGWSINASLNSKYINKTIVSSDDEKILDISIKCGAEIIRRPDYLSSDDATSEGVVRHAIDYLSSKGEVFDSVILLQPTSPLRSSIDIDEAFDAMFDSNATAVISVFEGDNKMLKAFVNRSDGFLEGICNNKYPFMRRQDLPKVYVPNGAIYINKIASFLKDNSFFSTSVVSYIMLENKSIDIDTHDDLIVAELYLNDIK
jgi:CMP-N,N'-diacetyllegionaminic acid synthase